MTEPTAKSRGPQLWGDMVTSRPHAPGWPAAPAAHTAPRRLTTQNLLLAGGAALLLLQPLLWWLVFAPANPPAETVEALGLLRTASGELGTLSQQLEATSQSLGQLDQRLTRVEAKLGPSPDQAELKKQVAKLRDEVKDLGPLVREARDRAGSLNNGLMALGLSLRPSGADAKQIDEAARKAAAAVHKGVKEELARTADAVKAAAGKELDRAVKKAAAEAGDKAADKAAESTDTIVSRLETSLKNTRGEVDALSQAMAALVGQLRREQAPLRVALVLSHAREVDANKVIGAVEAVVRTAPYKTFPRYDLGAYVVADDKVWQDKPLRPLDGTRWTKVKPRPAAVEKFDRPPPARQSVEKAGQVSPADLFGDAKDRPWSRRCIFIVTTGCAVPAKAADWKDIAVDVVLIDRPNTPKAKENEQAWRDFTRDHRGVAVTLPAKPGQAGDYTVEADDVRAYLERLAHPK